MWIASGDTPKAISNFHLEIQNQTKKFAFEVDLTEKHSTIINKQEKINIFAKAFNSSNSFKTFFEKIYLS